MNNKKSDRDTLVDMYILGRLEESERMEFEEAMQADEELSQEVALMQSIVESLSEQEEMRRKMQVWKESASASQKVRVFNWIKVASAIAACALLVFGLSYPCSYHALQDGEFYEMSLRGDLAQITGFLENGQYNEALDFISTEALYREGLLDGDQELSPSKEKYYRSELQYLQWAEIQALLKMRDYDQAFEKLELFRNDAGIYKDKADRLYWRLKIRTIL